MIILFLAWFLSTRLDQMQGLAQHAAARRHDAGRVYVADRGKQPDLGTALVVAGVSAMMLILAGMDWKYLFLAVAAAAATAGCAACSGFRGAARACWPSRNPDLDPQGAGFHINQSLIAVGTGGFAGRGYMEGMQKLFYLPEAHTDFIFANIAEELGFVGAIVILVLFVVLGYRGLRTAFRSTDPFARLTAFGITTAILLQAFFNISVVLSLLPTKGIPLPFISSGGTSLFFTLAGIGILLNISKKVD